MRASHKLFAAVVICSSAPMWLLSELLTAFYGSFLAPLPLPTGVALGFWRGGGQFLGPVASLLLLLTAYRSTESIKLEYAYAGWTALLAASIWAMCMPYFKINFGI